MEVVERPRLHPPDLRLYATCYPLFCFFCGAEGRTCLVSLCHPPPPRHTQEIKGCLQFRYKPFFTPPSTHRKPITSNAALATNLIMEAFHHLMCVQLHLRVCICHFVLSPAVIIFGKHGWNCYCSPAKKCLIPYPWMFVCSHKMCKDSSGLCVCVCVYFPGDLHGL